MQQDLTDYSTGRFFIDIEVLERNALIIILEKYFLPGFFYLRLLNSMYNTM